MPPIGTLNTYQQKVSLYVLSNVVYSGSAFLLLPIAARYLSQADLGIVFLAQSIILCGSTIIGMGSVAVIQPYFVTKRQTIGEYIGTTIAIGTFMFCIVLGALLVLHEEITAALALPPSVLLYVALISPLVFIYSLSQCSFQMTEDALGYLKQVSINVAFNVPIAISLIVFYSPSWVSRVLGLGLGVFFANLYGLKTLLGHHVRLGTKSQFAEIFLKGGPVVIHSFSTLMFNQTDKFIISSQISNDAVGSYGVSSQFATVISTLAAALAVAYSPLLFRSLENPNQRKFRVSVRNALRVSALGICLAGGILIFLLYFFSDVILGPEFDFRFDIFLFLLLGQICFGIYHFYSPYFYYYGKTHLLALITVSAALLNVVLSYVLIKWIGLLGPAISSLVCFSFTLLCAVAYSSVSQSRKSSVKR